MTFTTDTHRKVRCDEPDVETVEVRPDREGLGCVELVQIDMRGVPGNRMSFPPEQAIQVAKAMLKCAEELSDL